MLIIIAVLLLALVVIFGYIAYQVYLAAPIVKAIQNDLDVFKNALGL